MPRLPIEDAGGVDILEEEGRDALVEAALKDDLNGKEGDGARAEQASQALSASSDMLATLALAHTAANQEQEDAASEPKKDVVAVGVAVTEVDVQALPPAAVEGTEVTSADQAAIDEEVARFYQQYTEAQLSRGLEELEGFCQAHDVPLSMVAARLKELKGLDLEALRKRAAVVEQGIQECANDEGWTVVQDSDLRLLYRHKHGSTVHGFKGSCVLPAPVEQPLSMAREFDLVKTWNSYITTSDFLQVSCNVDLLAYAAVWMPWPLAERDVYIEAVGLDRLKEDGCVAISFSSPLALPEGMAAPAGYDQRAHVGFMPGSCMVMRPLAPENPGGPQRTQVVVTSLIETHMAFVPETIIQFVLRVFAPFFYSAVVKTLDKCFHDESDALPKRIAERPELYAMLAERIQEFLDGTIT